MRFIKNGIFGIAGHVCACEQDISEFVNRLPRHKNDVTMLNVLCTVDQEIGNNETRVKALKVRKEKVGQALQWLNTYNKEYNDIEIDMTALDWLEGTVGSMDNLMVEGSDNMETAHDTCLDVNTDQGPAPDVTMHTTANQNEIKEFGYTKEGGEAVLSPRDSEIMETVWDEIDHSSTKEKISVRWPVNSAMAVSKYSYSRLFARAYPWLAVSWWYWRSWSYIPAGRFLRRPSFQEQESQELQ